MGPLKKLLSPVPGVPLGTMVVSLCWLVPSLLSPLLAAASQLASPSVASLRIAFGRHDMAAMRCLVENAQMSFGDSGGFPDVLLDCLEVDRDLFKALLDLPTIDLGMADQALISAVAQRGDAELIRILLGSPSVDPGEGNGRALRAAIRSRNVEAVQELVKDGRVPTCWLTQGGLSPDVAAWVASLDTGLVAACTVAGLQAFDQLDWSDATKDTLEVCLCRTRQLHERHGMLRKRQLELMGFPGSLLDEPATKAILEALYPQDCSTEAWACRLRAYLVLPLLTRAFAALPGDLRLLISTLV